MADGQGTGATPGEGATPEQGPQNTTTTPAGAMPAATQDPQPPRQSATDDESTLGDPGKRILAEARRAAKDAEDRARAAEQERDALKVATQSEAEKARDDAVKEAVTTERSRSDGLIRLARVESALRAAGLASARVIALSAQAPEFATLKVTDKGEVQGLDEAIEAFKKDYGDLFAGEAPPPVPTLGAQASGAPPEPATLEDAVKAHYRSP